MNWVVAMVALADVTIALSNSRRAAPGHRRTKFVGVFVVLVTLQSALVTLISLPTELVTRGSAWIALLFGGVAVTGATVLWLLYRDSGRNAKGGS